MSAGDRYYCLASLPAPGGLGSPPPLGPIQMLEHLTGCPRARSLVETLFLRDDLTQREAFLAGETADVAPVVLTPDQARNAAPLPDFLTPDPQTPEHPVPADNLWETYFRHAMNVARRLDSPFLSGWVRHEVGLRNALAAARARRLGLEPADYRVAPEIAAEDTDFSETVSQWQAASDPLQGERLLIRARWTWTIEHARWFSFSNDELAAYADQIMLLQQWRRATAAQPAAPQADEDPS